MQLLHSCYAGLLAGSALLRLRVQLTDQSSSAELERLHVLYHSAAFSDASASIAADSLIELVRSSAS